MAIGPDQVDARWCTSRDGCMEQVVRDPEPSLRAVVLGELGGRDAVRRGTEEQPRIVGVLQHEYWRFRRGRTVGRAGGTAVLLRAHERDDAHSLLIGFREQVDVCVVAGREEAADAVGRRMRDEVSTDWIPPERGVRLLKTGRRRGLLNAQPSVCVLTRCRTVSAPHRRRNGTCCSDASDGDHSQVCLRPTAHQMHPVWFEESSMRPFIVCELQKTRTEPIYHIAQQ